MEVKKTLTKRDLRIIQGAINSSMDQVKAMIRKDENIPLADELYDSFTQKLPFLLDKNKAPKFYREHIIRTNFLNEILRQGIYQVIFYFNNKVMYISAVYKDKSYRGNKYFDFYNDVTYLDEYFCDGNGVENILDSILEGCYIEDVDKYSFL